MKKGKIILLSYLSFCLMLLFNLTAFAYIDPAVISYTIPAVAGVLIAGGAIFFTWWRKVKSKVSKKLGIDENAGKEVEEDVVIKTDSEINGDTEKNKENDIVQ